MGDTIIISMLQFAIRKDIWYFESKNERTSLCNGISSLDTLFVIFWWLQESIT